MESDDNFHEQREWMGDPGDFWSVIRWIISGDVLCKMAIIINNILNGTLY